MKILFIIYSLSNGGAEVALYRLYHALKERGHEVQVITFSCADTDYNIESSICIHSVSRNFFLLKILNIIKRIIRVKIIKRKLSPQISISYMLGSNLVNIISSSKSEKTISTIHGSNNNESIFIKIINKFIFKNSDALVTVSKGVMNHLLQRYEISAKKIRVIHNFVPFTSFTRDNNSNNQIRLITIGRLENVKAQWHLLHVVKELKKLAKNVELMVLGRGPLYNSLSELIIDLDLAENISLLGFKEDVVNYLKKSDLFLLSSTREGFSNVIIEALAVGLPVISTDAPYGPKEILNPEGIELYNNDHYDAKYGLMVELPRSLDFDSFGQYNEYVVRQFVNKILFLKSDPIVYSYYSQKSLERASTFSKKRVVDEWEDLFNKIIK